MSEKDLQRFVEIKQQIDKLEEELEGLKEKVFSFVEAAQDNKIETDDFVAKATTRISYDFSDDYEAKNKELKELRKEEIKNGTATEKGRSEYVTLKMK